MDLLNEWTIIRMEEMNTKIVYVLSSDENDLFWEQCLISVMSARHHMPNSTIYLVCDDTTVPLKWTNRSLN